VSEGLTAHELAMKIRYNATAIQACVTDLVALLDELGLSDRQFGRRNINGPVLAVACPGCGCNGAHAADCEDA